MSRTSEAEHDSLTSSDEENEETRKLPWGMTKDGVKPGSIKQLTSTKVKTFKIGFHSKSRFQRHKEEEEQKRKQAEREAAEVYKDFVASFEDSAPTGQTFVKAGTLQPSVLYQPEASSGGEKRQIYRPTTAFVKAKASGTDRSPAKPGLGKRNLLADDDDDDDDEDKRGGGSDDEAAFLRAEPIKSLKTSVEEARSKKRTLDAFMENMKRERDERESRLRARRERGHDLGAGVVQPSLTVQAAFEHGQGSHDLGDPDTTNLFVSNISESTTEEAVCEHFGKYGPIASVKIMWPWTVEERSVKGNRMNGFVAFMKRRDAEEALKNLDGSILCGNALRCGWGKAMLLPSKACYVSPAYTSTKSSGRPFGAHAIRSRDYDRRDSRSHRDDYEVRVERPLDPDLLHRIHHTVKMVVEHGARFEATIMAREEENPRFAFLFDHELPEHVYYRWLLFATLNGDNEREWSERPFRMFDEGSLWIPPKLDRGFTEGVPGSEDHKISAASEDEYDYECSQLPKGQLGPAAKRRLAKLIRQHTEHEGDVESRERVGEFALEHVDCADKTIEMITQSLLLPDTPYPIKLMRFQLVSEVLHRSGQATSGTWKLRASFEARLPDIFAHFGTVCQAIPSRLKGENFKRALFNHLRDWELHALFTHEQLSLFADRFEGIEKAKQQQQRQRQEEELAKETDPSTGKLTPASTTKRPGFRPVGAPAVEPDAETSGDTVHPPHQAEEKVASSAAGTTKPSGFVPITASQARHEAPSSPEGPAQEANECVRAMQEDEDDEEEEEDDDIDGEPLMLNTIPPAGNVSAKMDSVDTEDADEDEDEDIDGVPLEEMQPAHTATAAAAPSSPIQSRLPKPIPPPPTAIQSTAQSSGVVDNDDEEFDMFAE